MADYTHMTIEDVTDAGPQFGAEGFAEIRFANDQMGTAQTGFTHHRVQPDVHSGFGHRHQEAEEVYFVIAGGGRAKLDDEVIEIAKGDALRVAPEVIRSFASGPEGLEMLAFGAKHEGDGEVFPDWWPAG